MNQLSDIAVDDLVALLKADIASEQKQLHKINALDRDRAYVSYAQQRLWFLQQYNPQDTSYNQVRILKLNGSLNAVAIESALQKVVERHAILRTSFVEEEDGLFQVVDKDFHFSLRKADFSGMSEEQRQESINAACDYESATPFDLSRSGQIRGQLLKISEQQHILIITTHHIVSDAESNPILVADLSEAYRISTGNTPQDKLPALSIQYVDYAEWQHTKFKGNLLADDLNYWREYLGEDIPVLQFPTDFLRPSSQDNIAGQVPLYLSEELSTSIHQLAASYRATPLAIVMAAWQILLYRYSGQTEFGVGVPNANRNLDEVQGVVGCFMGSQVFKARIDPFDTAEDLIIKLREEIKSALEYELPFELLLDSLKIERSVDHPPLFQTLIDWKVDGGGTSKLAFEDLSIEIGEPEIVFAKYDLSLHMLGIGNQQLGGVIEFNSGVFKQKTIEQIANHYQRLLEAMVRDSSQRVSEVLMLSNDETHRILREWNDTAVDYGETSCIHSLFEVQVEKTPEAIALIFPQEGTEQRLTYAELNSQANRLAHRLRSLGMGPDVLVGIAVERSVEMVIGLLGILKAGGAYVPLDPEYPEDRLGYMMADSGIQLLLTQTWLQKTLPVPADVKVLCLDQVETWQQDRTSNLPLVTNPQNLAYVIYTSGSTGKPKGVSVLQQGVINLLLSMGKQPGLKAGDRFLALTSLSFDIAALELYLPLITGASIVMLSREMSKDPSQIIDIAEQNAVTHIQATPSTWKMLVNADATALLSYCTLLMGGEALPEVLVQDILQSAECLWNVYGPTETTVWSGIYRLDKTNRKPYIGSPIDNTEIYILGDEFNPQPIGVVGELYIAGAGLARGYHSRSDLTAERFVPDPYGEAGGKLYRTGDLARYQPDGMIEYVGRVDHQVKIRGFRIELGEIESQLNAQAEVKEAAVIAQQVGGTTDGQQLVAYVIPVDSTLIDEAVDVDAKNAFRAGVKAQLQAVLPEYMVPNQYVLLDKLPLTPNGKLDRKVLPKVDGNAFRRGYEVPQTELEQQLASIWQEVLGVERVGLNDNFFELGGHSLLATQVASRIRQTLKVDLLLRVLFEATDLRSLAQHIIIESPVQVAPIEQISREQPLFLSYAQQRQWVLWQLEPDSAAYHISAVLRLKGILNVEALGKSFDTVIARHEVLRTHFAEQDGELYQVIVPMISLPLSPEVFEITEGETEKQALKRTLQVHASEPFNLTEGPLLRARLIYLGNDDYVLSLVQHHIISDAWSMRLMVEELVAAYQAYSQNQLPVLPELPIQYADYAAWQRQIMEAGEAERQLSYWQEQLGDEQPMLELPLDHPRPQQPSYQGASWSQVLPQDLSIRVLTEAKRAGVTPFMLLLASFQLLLHRYSGQDDIRVGVPIANRTQLETERLVGFFVNTQVLRAQISPETTVSDLLQQVKRTALEAQAHQDLPFEQLVEALQPERSLSYTPLFQVMFNYFQADQSGEANKLLVRLENLTVEGLAWEHETAQFDLTLDVSSTPDGLFASFNYATDLFEHETVERLAWHWQRLLEAMIKDPLQRVSELSMLSSDEINRILREWNATVVDYGKGNCIHSLFESQVEKTPEATALIFPAWGNQPEQTLTYMQLNTKTNQLAHTLRKMSVGPDILVGIAVERSVEMVIGLLGVLKAGGAYVPLDPEYPGDRLSYMMQDSGIRLLLTQTSLQNTLSVPADMKVLCLDQAETWQESDTSNLPLVTNPQNLAYVIYTSGSTGRPKGVAISNQSLARHAFISLGFFNMSATDCVLQFATLNFDGFVEQLYPPLICGASVVLRGPEIWDSETFYRELVDKNISIVDLTTAYWFMLARDFSLKGPRNYGRLHRVHSGGEAMPAEGVTAWKQAGLERVHLLNTYGPTEATVTVSAYNCYPHLFGVEPVPSNIPIGRTLGGRCLYLLDYSGNHLAENITGELFVGGELLARGYHGRPGLTAERFVPDPYDENGGGRLYRTGDLARYRTDGNIEYVGRIDYQVKIRGFRIELGEIESQLNAQIEVKEAVVIAQQVGDTGGQQLVAYVVPGDSTLADEAVDVDVQNAFRVSVKAQLKAILPEYMVPNQYVLLDKLPLTPNGKLDRKALPKVDGSAFTREYQAPRTELEQQLAGIWQSVLGVEQVGLNDNFFELGGHSLLAIQVISRIRQSLATDLSLRALFETSDLRALVERVSQKEKIQLAPIERVSRERLPSLSYAQQRQWVLWQLEPGSAAYHISAALHLKGVLNREALHKSFDVLIARHEVLRTHFAEQDGELYQVIVPHLSLSLVEEALAKIAEETEEAALQRILQHHAEEPFELTTGPLLRVKLIYLSDNDHVLALAQHHIVSDAWSMQVMVDELVVAYQAYSQDQLPVLPELPIQYADYAVWQRHLMEAGEGERQLSYWRKQLGDEQPVLELPLDHPRPQQPSYQGASLSQMLSSELAIKMERKARAAGVTPFMFLLVSFQVLLHRYSGQDDIRVGVPIANRTRLETERLIGFFVNTQILRAQINLEATVNDLLQQVKRTALEAQAYQDLPFEQLVEALQPERSLSYSPLFQVMFNYLQDDQSRESDRLLTQLGDLTVEGLTWEQQTAQFDLTLNMSSSAEGMVASFNYATDLFERSTIERLANHWQRILAAMVRDPLQRISELPLLSGEETHRILREWNDTAVDYGAGTCIHNLFEAQVEKTPEAIALIFPQEGTEQRLTYAELNSRANQLAHRLRSLSVGPDVLVGIAVERSIEMVIGLLGILKAGGAYVPLDPEYPAERLSYMMTDSGIDLLLTQERLQEHLPIPEGVQVLNLDGQSEVDWQQESDENLPLITLSGNLAYIIYTSGSTGKPKGTLLAHRNVSRLMQAIEQWFHFDNKDVWTLFHSYAFDFSVWEMFGALLYGGKLIIVPREVARSTEDFYTLLCDYGVTVLNQTPSAFRQLMDVACFRASDAMVLRHVIFGGEALAVESLQPWFERFGDTSPQLTNMYGITETTVHVTYRPLFASDKQGSPLGRPIDDLSWYILDGEQQPVLPGCIGELYIGGAGLARGYLGRAGLTAERFVPDPYGEVGGRLYRTGDLARYRTDGNIEYVGRIDHQVKIRGFRIELGEIESQLLKQSEIKEAVVVDQYGPTGVRLVGYVVAQSNQVIDTTELRKRLGESLPDYMVPNVIIAVEMLPLTPHGKLDRKALPEPDFGNNKDYEAPQGEVEEKLTQIWSEVLGVERVGRNDNFFELGGHSLLALKLAASMRNHGWSVPVRTLFRSPQLRDFAQTVAQSDNRPAVIIPPNGIPNGCKAIQPEMVTLVDLQPEELASIEAVIPGGATNIQDIYPLAPLQEGILFHHLLQMEGDVYITSHTLRFDTKERLEHFIRSFNQVIARHDILRTAVLWENLKEPVQVVCRQAELPVQWLELDKESSAIVQLDSRTESVHYRIDVRQAPMLRLIAAYDTRQECWLVKLLSHHLIDDNTTLQRVVNEIALIQKGRVQELPEPLPFRHFIAQSRMAVSDTDHQDFFSKMLGDVDEPTVPFNLQEVRGDGTEIDEAILPLSEELAVQVRQQAQKYGVSAAAIFHLAWALVVGKTSNRSDVVFGTVLLGRMSGGEGAERALGLFINTLPIRIQLGQQSVAQSLQQTHEILSDLMEHEHASLGLAMRCSALSAGTPLFSALLNYRHTRQLENEATSDTVEGIEILAGKERTNYPFGMSIDDDGNGLGLVALVQAGIGAKRICEMMHIATARVAEALANKPDQSCCELNLLSQAEQNQLRLWSANSQCYSDVEPVHCLFEVQVEQTPEAIALIFPAQVNQPEQTLTYAELNNRANQLAHRLRSLGVGPDVLVGIAVERSIEMVVTVLAILKAGGAYVPLDPAYPADRLAYMASNSRLALLVTQKSINGKLPLSDDIQRVFLEDDRSGYPVDNLLTLIHDRNLAYVIFTSGTTGLPKGVGIDQGSLARHTEVYADRLALTNVDCVLQYATLNFDTFGEQVFPSLCRGARVIVRGDEIWDHNTFYDNLIHYGISVANLTPSLWFHLIKDFAMQGRQDFGRLRRMIVGGEAMPPEALIIWQQLGLSQCVELWNFYGPTEATAATTSFCCNVFYDGDKPIPTTIPIGEPLQGRTVYIVSDDLNLLPSGVAGELVIGGELLARGYLGRPGLTAERFVPDPYDEQGGGRLYRTGDLARYRTDGNIEYVGRIDHQVKIRGFRIELGEIESQLQAQTEVRDAVVIAQQVGETSGQQLVAYVVPDDSTLVAEVVDADVQNAFRASMKAQLQAALPEYMVPNQYVLLDKLPLTPNGKLNRKALPAVEGSAFQRVYEAPRTELECQLAEIWQSVLGVEQVGLNDNFFELGGHSLLATQIISRIRQSLAANLPLRTLFETTDLRSLAQHIAIESPVQVTSIERISREQPLLLSYAQQRQWILWQLEPSSAAYHISAALRLQGILDVEALNNSFEVVIARHEVLRTHFTEQDGELCQVIVPTLSLPLSPQALEITEGETEDQALKHMLQVHASEPFNLAQGPLLRAQLIYLGDDDHVLSLVQHHIVSDAWSMRVMVEELVAAYRAYSHGQLPVLPELPIQYADYAAWQRQIMKAGEAERQLSYWREQLGDEHPVLELPTDHPRSQQPSYRGANYTLALPKDVSTRVLTEAKRAGVTPFMLLLASFQVLLYRYSGQDDIRVGVPIANRTRLEIEQLIGFFVNTQVLRAQISPEATVNDLLQQVKRTALEAQAHQDLPFEQLVEALQPERSLNTTPLFQVMFNYLQADRNGESDKLLAQLEDLTVEGLAWKQQTAQFDLTLDVSSTTDGLFAAFNYATDLFEYLTIERLAYHWQRILAEMVRDSSQRIAEIPLLDEVSGLYKEGGISSAYPLENGYASLFEEQVERHSGEVVARYKKEEWTYFQLNQKANRLAHELIARGVLPDTPVALLAERGLPLLGMINGVFKAAAGYLPLDPAHPIKRLVSIIESSTTRVLVCDGQSKLLAREVCSLLPGNKQPEILVWEGVQKNQSRSDNPNLEVTGQHLAYVIYTSGSTGEPKGVMVEQAGMLNNQLSKIPYLELTESDVIAQTASQVFDISVWQFLTAGLCGARVEIVPDEISRDLDALLEYVRETGITILESVPALISSMLTGVSVEIPDLRYLLPTGEAMPPKLAQQWMERYPEIKLVNAYGPAECSDDVALHRVEFADTQGTYLPVGEATDNNRLFVMDNALSMMPWQATGELYIAGTGVGRGYLADPVRTAEAFVPNEFAEQPGERLYRSGDLVRRRYSDGVIEYVGRIDHQVKVRGFRIELGEIESQLNAQAEVKETVVIAQQVGETGGQKLVAYVVPTNNILVDETVDTDIQNTFKAGVKANLQAALPEYMVPNQYVLLDKLPLTPNGKLDRKALPKVEGSAFQRTYEAPRTELERQLASIWQGMLGVERVGLNDNFFELGGHSLLAVKLLAEIRKQLRVESVGLLDILQAQTIGKFVKHINQSIPRELSPLVRLNQCDRNKKPLFCLHPISGSVYPYYPLALRLKDERPVYGIMCRTYIESGWADRSWDCVVDDYLRYIRETQPHGPYLLLGWSLGGALAQDIASRLELAGEEILFLGLVDTMIINNPQILKVDEKEQSITTTNHWSESLNNYEKKTYYFIRAFFPEVDDSELKDLYLSKKLKRLKELDSVNYALKWIGDRLKISTDFLKIILDQVAIEGEINLGSEISKRFYRLVTEAQVHSYQVRPICWWAVQGRSSMELKQAEYQIAQLSSIGKSIYLPANHEKILYLPDFLESIVEILKFIN